MHTQQVVGVVTRAHERIEFNDRLDRLFSNVGLERILQRGQYGHNQLQSATTKRLV
jgi:hypothetical protein